MKKLMIALALAGLMSAPAVLNAQDGREGEGGEWGGEGVEGDAKSPQEMMDELHKLMKKASDEMGELEGELAKASLDAPKPDVIEERIERVRKLMEEGKIDEMPEGLRKHIEENPEDVAEATDKSNEEVREIAGSSDKLEELLRKNPELLKKLAQNEETMESIRNKQHDAEKKLAETLKKQGESAEAAKQKVDESLDIAHQLSQKGQGQGQGQPKNDKSESSNDPREQEEKQGGKQPNQNAEDQYNPDGSKKPKNETEEFERGEGDGFQADRKDKDMGDARSSEDRREPGKYKGFWEKFRNEAIKKVEESKKKDSE